MVGVVIVGLVYHSGLENLELCLDSVRPATDRKIVVLDASSGGSARQATAPREDVIWMNGSRNGGYAWGIRQIADAWLTPGDIFVAANADVQFLPDTMSRIVAHASDLDGVCYPLQLDETGSAAAYNLQGQLGLMESIARWLGLGRRGLRRRIAQTIEDAANFRGPTRVPAALCGSGAMLVMNQSVWEQCGGLDPQFFLFSEDKSFGTVAESLGIPAYICGDAPIVHEGGFRGRGVSAFGMTEALVSEQLCWKKSMRSPTAVVIAIQIVGLVLRVVSCTLSRRTGARAAYWTALRYRLRHLSTKSAAPTGADGVRIAALSDARLV